MSTVQALGVAQLYTRCDANQFNFELSSELEDLTEIVGQARALAALHFGINIRKQGDNLFVLGPHGSGKYTMVRQYLESQAINLPVPSDWCYVHNFSSPHKPIALELPAGRGVNFREDVKQLLEDLRTVIPQAFETKEYRARIQEIEEDIETRRESAFKELEQQAKENNIVLASTPSGYMFLPTKDGKTIKPKDYQQLSEEERQKYETAMTSLQEKMNNFIQQIPEISREAKNRVKELNREVAIFGVGPLFKFLKDKYQHLSAVITYLDAYQEDVLQNIDEFRNPEPSKGLLGLSLDGEKIFRRYTVNLLVEHDSKKGAPVIYEDNPTFNNLVGRIEHLAQIGALVTDFSLIKPGALHLANGGFLILEAKKLLLQPYAWEGLKRTLYSGKINIQSLGEIYSVVSTVSLEAQPIPLDLKVVLLGDRIFYYLLLQYDSDFPELFKIGADFEEEIDRSPENNFLYARMIATLVRKEKLIPFERSAIARIIEYSSRQADDASKLTTHMLSITDLMRESDQWARESNSERVTVGFVEMALEKQIQRVDRVRNKIQEEIYRGNILIDVEGKIVGQVNGLSVVNLGDFSFALPTRITATTFAGDGKVIDISREADLAGAIHSKGVMILTSFLSARFARDYPLAVSASITFEQTYGKVEGDSASVAELCALLSSIAQIPIDQGLALTGSVNQLGQVQAIGGVNEKIEGFFETCQRRGLNGNQGVIIPASNIKHLMLNRNVVVAAEAGQFHIYSVSTVDEAISLLTGMEAGKPDISGKYAKNTINGRIQARFLKQYRKRQKNAEHGHPLIG